MGKRFVDFTLGAMLLALCVSAEAQQPTKVLQQATQIPRIGYLGAASAVANRARIEACQGTC